MRFNFKQWAATFASTLLGLFASGNKIKGSDVGQIAAGTALNEIAQDNQPKP